MNRSILARCALAALPLALAACDARNPASSSADPLPPAAAPANAVTLACTASVAAGSIRCDAPPSTGVRTTLTLGGQGTYVKLASANVSYDGTQTFKADVTVQNLLSEALGTPDGTTVTGVKVFFLTGPTPTGGTGSVDVQNPTGYGAFTTAGQPYFLYNQVLLPRGTSQPLTWKFDVPNTVSGFTFTVAVSAQAPAESGALRWLAERGPVGTEHLQGIWGASDSSVFAVGQGGVVQHWNGHTWTELVTGTTSGLNAVSGTSATDVEVAGSFGTLLHYDGNWTAQNTGGTAWFGVWAAAPGDAFAVGSSGAIRRWNGSTWSAMTAPGGLGNLNAVWGTSGSNVYAVGDNGVILHWDGAAWSTMTSNFTKSFEAVWGSSASDVWAVGQGGNVRHYDGVSWDSVASATSGVLYGIAGSSSTDVYAVGNFGTIVHWDGTAWSSVPAVDSNRLAAVWGSPSGRFFADGDVGTLATRAPGGSWAKMTVGTYGDYLYNVAAASTSDAWAVGYGGLALHWDGKAWTSAVLANTYANWYGVWYDGAGSWWVTGAFGYAMRSVNGAAFAPVPSGTSQTLRAVWGASPTDVFAVGTLGTILHHDGSGFSPVASGTTQDLYGAWGTSGSDVFAVGRAGTILHYDGTSWSPMTSNTTADLYAVWGSSHANVWAVGFNGTVVHYDGASWSVVPTGMTQTLNGVWVAPNGSVFVTGYNGLLLRYVSGAWRAIPGTSEILYGVRGLSDRDLYVVGAGQLILHGIR
jgi:hypothetical protein